MGIGSQLNSYATIPDFILKQEIGCYILNHARVRQIWEVIVLVLKCALAIAAVMAIYCLVIVLMEHLSD
ncbi:hypothetical protein BV389_28500 [Escherichia coli]|nr:hypothetical protein BV389_28500 [Escherichia coli]OTC32761.1 hypothetical protein AW079_26760 [Escherichia coli]GIP93420.1 hypothetical protein EC07E033_42940 [Escherichia coli]